MARLSVYEVRFRARTADELAGDLAVQLRSALDGVPGIARALGADHDAGSRTVTGAFQLEVARGMAAAARDSSRMAKEALKLAGMGDARLVELTIALRQTVSGA
jgi:hypothetical protein